MTGAKSRLKGGHECLQFADEEICVKLHFLEVFHEEEH
jgi:hypothetical protein